MKTALTELMGISLPVIQAPMAGSVTPALAAAVSEAGGLGSLPLWHLTPEQAGAEIEAFRKLSGRPFLTNFNNNFDHRAQLEAALRMKVPAVSLFWGFDPEEMAMVKEAGAVLFQSVGTAAEAKEAVRLGADVIVAQGWEAGGHVWGEVSTLALVPAAVDAVHPVPVVAAGGIADGRGLAAVLALGAAGAWVGTRFLASPEAWVHEEYRKRIVGAVAEDTLWSRELFEVGWPDAGHRVLKNSTSAAWEAAGRPKAGARPGEGDVIVRDGTGAEAVRYQIWSPKPDDIGDVEPLSMWAGQGVGLVRDVAPAGDIVRGMVAEAEAVLARLGT